MTILPVGKYEQNSRVTVLVAIAFNITMQYGDPHYRSLMMLQHHRVSGLAQPPMKHENTNIVAILVN